jgi:plasmid stability protein
MPVNLSIKNAPDDIVRRLRERAEQHHRSLQGELMAIIEQAVQETQPVATVRGDRDGRDPLVLLPVEEYSRLKCLDNILAGRNKPNSPEEDPLSELFARLHEKVKASGLSAAEVDAELASYNAETHRS